MKSTDFLKEHNAFIAQDAEEMHRDNEVQMARADLYNAADYAIKLHKILRGVNDSADMEQWVMEKIAIANENLRTVYEYLNYENKEQELPVMAFESLETAYNTLLESEQLDELSWGDVKKGVAGAALAGTMAMGGMGAAHADEAPRDVPAATAQADAQVPLSQRYTQGASFPDAYVVAYKGHEYKFAGRSEAAPKGGEVITVPAGAVGIRGLKPVQITLTKDGKYYAGTAEGVNESASCGASSAGGFATGPVGDAAPMQRRVKSESAKKNYGNANKVKQPKFGKGVY